MKAKSLSWKGANMLYNVVCFVVNRCVIKVHPDHLLINYVL